MIGLPQAVTKGKIAAYQQIDVYNSNTVHTFPKCEHTGGKVIFTRGDRTLYGASSNGIQEFSGKWDLIIDLAWVLHISEGFVSSTSPSRFQPLKAHTTQMKYPSEVLQLDWPDMQAPPADLVFWDALWPLLPAKTVVCCQGGHGRTGTCLAALMISAGLDYYTALKTVRAEHCNKAVETSAQERYLHDLYVAVLTTHHPEGWEESLEFATTHTPSFKNSYGEDVTVVDGQDADSIGSPYGEYPSEDIKIQAGLYWVRDCKEATCTAPNCKNRQHYGWVKWGPIAPEAVWE